MLPRRTICTECCKFFPSCERKKWKEGREVDKREERRTIKHRQCPLLAIIRSCHSKRFSLILEIPIDKWYKLSWVKACVLFSFISVLPNLEPVMELVFNKSVSKWRDEWTELQSLRYGSTGWSRAPPLTSLLFLGEMEMNSLLQGVER